MIDMGIPAQVRALRRSYNLKREVFASYLGVTPYTVYRWEAGRARPKRSITKMTEEIEAAVIASRKLQEIWSPFTYKTRVQV